MQLASIGAFAPVALLITSFTNCSLISLPFLFAFLFIQHKSQWRSIDFRIKVVFWVVVLVYSMLAFFIEGATTITWYIEGKTWSSPSNWLTRLMDLARFNPWLSMSHVWIVLSSQFVVIVTTACALNNGHNCGNLLHLSWGSPWFRAILRSILLPGVQLVVGVARPCWISFPFFICSCVGLLHWAITSSFVGLSWGWRMLLLFTGFDVVLLYLYQMPFEYSELIVKAADYLGLFQVSQEQYQWPEIVQSIALLAFYILLSVSIYDVEEADKHRFHGKDVLPRTCNGAVLALSCRSNECDHLTERLLGSPKMSHEKETKSSSSWTETLPNCQILQLISINFFIYGFPTLFFLIVVDRVMYLCSFALGKICYYFFNLGLFTYYATHYDWQMSTKEHGLFLLRIFCLIKGLSLFLQALQIKYGLPHKAALYEQFLTRKVCHLNHIGFRLYRSLPFLFELRCILDWSCSTTSLTMYDWLKLEDIYASLYLVQCDVKLSREKHQLGKKRGMRPKIFSGICTFLVLICIIWAPMLAYSYL